MKRYFIAGMAIILVLVVSIVGYGAYLNYRGENQITKRMADRRLQLHGSYAKVREIFPFYEQGAVTLVTDDTADMTALTNGRVQQIFVKKNQHVKPGDPILEIVDDEMDVKLKQADSAVLKEEAAYKRAKNSFVRYQQLISMNAVSYEKYDEAEANFRAASASLEEAKARKEQLLVQASYRIVRAEIEGDVIILYKQVGAYVQAGTPIAMIADFQRLSYTMNLADNIVRSFSVGQQFDMWLSDLGNNTTKIYGTKYMKGNDGDNQRFKMTIVEITPDMSQPAEMRQVRLVVDNSSGILEPQTYSDISFRSEQKRSCLTIPLTAINNQSEPSVFVYLEDGTIERRDVVVGDDDGTYAEIITGLSEGDLVISSGTEDLSDGMAAEVAVEE